MEAASHHQRHILNGQCLSSLPSKSCRQSISSTEKALVSQSACTLFIYLRIPEGGPLSTYGGTSQRPPPPLFQPRPIGCSSSGEIMWEITTAALQMTVICRWHMSIAHLTIQTQRFGLTSAECHRWICHMLFICARREG
ncbi:hypothetical protein CDEST_13875 [Colletotrichum destructivum]|uniref:Uncharacterized protein n=1 Tax=Colletotrichum destructivum TaxID=34406 RepID=A0AAX4J095_9PEZI|nr:hypothetical protein CDEST_13875 [Colletotrichum destructivum]